MAKSPKSKNTDVIEIEAEEIPLEEQINTSLVKHNITDMVIAELKEKYGGLQLKSVDDKESYLEIVEARKEVRKWGIMTEKVTKAGRESAIKIQKLWLSKEKEVLGKIAEVQDPLDAEIKRYDDEQERKETEAAQRREEAAINRQAELTKMGAVYSNGSFVLNDVSFDLSLIKESDQDIWENSILVKYRVQYEKNEAVRLEQERVKAEQEEKLRKEREEFELQQKSFREQQEAFAAQQREADRSQRERLQAIQKEEDEKSRIKRLEEQKAEDERREQQRQKLERRANQLRALGMSFNLQYDAYVLELDLPEDNIRVCIYNKKEMLFDDAEWGEMIDKISPIIEQRKIAIKENEEKARKEQIKIAEEQAAQRERERIAEEQRLAKEKEQADEFFRQQEIAQASDKEKWDYLMIQIEGIEIPDMKSGQYRKMVQYVNKSLIEIKNLK